MLFRFLEYSYKDLEDMHSDATFLAGIRVNKNYDNFFNTLKKSKGLCIKIKDIWYKIDEVSFHYDGGEDDLFSCNIYCFEC